jgi:hypothetical protein
MAYSDEIFMDALAAHKAAQTSTATQTVFKNAVLAAIVTAFTAGLYTATVAVGSTPSQDVQYVLQQLNNSGYTASVTGTNLVANW